MNARVCCKFQKLLRSKEELVRLQGDCICQQCNPPSGNIHVLRTEHDVPAPGVSQLEDQPLPGAIPGLPVCARLHVQAPAKHRQRLGRDSILAGLVRVEHTVLEDEPCSLPTLATKSPTQVSRHLTALAIRTQLQPLWRRRVIGELVGYHLMHLPRDAAPWIRGCAIIRRQGNWLDQSCAKSHLVKRDSLEGRSDQWDELCLVV